MTRAAFGVFTYALALATMGCGVAATASAQTSAASTPASPDEAAIRASGELFVKAFDAGKADELAAMFVPQGELIDEAGNIHQGQAAIKELLTAFFAKYPGTKLSIEVEAVRVVGPVAFEEGVRTTTTKDGANTARVRYSVVRSKVGNSWPIVSLNDVSEDLELTPHERLEELSWLVGEWVNEGNDGAVRITYRWSSDQNFLLGEFNVTRGGSVVMQSTQRIGWDPLAGKVRSWMFDSDGGFGDGHWTQVEDAWVIKSTAVLPDGQTGSATITLSPVNKDRYKLQGTERIAGDQRDDDFEYIVTRKPPTPGK